MTSTEAAMQVVVDARPSPVLVARARQLLKKYRQFVVKKKLQAEGHPSYLALKAVLAARSEIRSGQ